ncbi:ATP-binding protein [Nocardiopsis aegyptia]|uniref:DNA-binding CsgD family transcriptional regulator/tetratricopeptide (TPR) repeat protein n=1 Tax=Nocardiopsis aegyptia TaxID=220378 RepID=A0A7Z0J9J2_9ACTN|nr:LuxR family transcriptional regulator [Nocardiopsis aegyptia]NYJ33469.1 DNA-binding CsgD family transcriptional regulator/tetratricopeptide (TPR) repeat protein [Nocardiopsis aegyptia]
MTGGPLLGRVRELAELAARLSSARAGAGSTVLVEGAAGIGKTALAHALVAEARDAGLRTAWGACLEGEGAPPYRPWIQVLRALDGPGTVLDDPESGAGASRFRLFDRVVAALDATASDHGLLVVLDDLHQADVSSIRLLQHVAAAVPDTALLLLGTLRSWEPPHHPELARALGSVRRERDTLSVRLGGLSPNEVAALAERTLSEPPRPDLVRLVQERSEGNPLFALELLRLVDAGGEAVGALPGGVREVIGHRLDRLPEPTRLLLRQASVLGRECDPAVLGEVAGLDRERLPDVLAPAVEAGLFTGGADERDERPARFTHVLVRDVLAAELSTTSRRRLHARAAEALDAVDGPERIDALAHHLRESLPLGDAARALDVTRRAAERARRRFAYEQAAYQYERALALPAAAPHRAGLLLELARCRFRSGAVEAAWNDCCAAANLARADGDGEGLADAAVVLRGVTNSPLTSRVHALCREALTLLGNADPVRRARLLAQLAVTADPFAVGEAPDWGTRALRAAEATGDPDARFLALQARRTELTEGRHVLERLSLGERAVRLGREAGIDEYVAWGHAWRLDAFWELGRRVQIDAELAELSSLVDHMREPLWVWRLTMMRAVTEAHAGRFDRARELADEALAVGRRGGHESPDFFHLVFTSHVALQTGRDLETVTDAVGRYVATGPFLSRSWHAVMLLGAGRRQEAADLWRSLVPHLGEFPRWAPEWIVATTGHARMAAEFGDDEVGADLYGQLLPYADRQICANAHTPCGGPVALTLGVVAARADGPRAGEHLRAALASAEAMGSPPYAAQCRLETGRLLMDGEPRLAREFLAAALDTARHLGMAPLATEAAGLLARARERETDRLTPRENEVAALIAEGLSNRQIARRLRLSERTAENHVAHILTKLGFSSRSRIASWHTGRPE